jgi:hypothetical protein
VRLPKEVNALIEIILADLGQVQEKITIDTIRNELAVRLAEENRFRPATRSSRPWPLFPDRRLWATVIFYKEL